MKRVNILLVDDDVNVLESLQFGVAYSSLGIEKIYVAENAADAKKILKNVPIHIMVTDIEMPNESGIELLKWTKTQNLDVVTIFCTCYADFNYAKKAVELQCFDYYLKPISFDDFEKIRQIIEQARQEAAYKVNETIISLYWNIGKFVSEKAQQDGWGRSTVKQLSQYILSKEPGIRGYSAQNIWRMKQFFETYQDKPELSTLLRANTWSNNLHIMSKTKTDEERAFYLKLASKEKYKARELERQIDSGYYERLLLSDGKAPSGIDHTENTGMIRDLYMLEFLNLPEPYKEFDLKQAILKNMKQFLLEFGRDFIFMGEEYHLQVGKNDYFVDLLFYHRELQCLVAIDLKIDDFKPEYLGKMEFYLEALDRDIRKPHENPSVGIILCKSKDEDVVEYALSRNMSSTMISEYRTKLISKEILQKKLEELYDAADESQNSQQC